MSDSNKSYLERNREAAKSVLDKSQDDFEKNLLYITTGTLGLSLAFIEKIIPLGTAGFVWLLVSSWIFLTLSLILNLLSHRMAIKNALKHGEIEEYEYLDEQAKYEAYTAFNKGVKSRSDKMDTINNSTVLLMILGIATLILFCSINAFNMKNISNNTPQATIDTTKVGREEGGRIPPALVLPPPPPKSPDTTKR